IVLSISTSPAATCFCSPSPFSFFFFFNAPAPTDIYTLSLHDALPISHLAYWQLLVPLVLIGLGFSAAIPAAQSSVLSHIAPQNRSEEHTSELQSLTNLVCRLLLEKKKNNLTHTHTRPNQPHRHAHTTS